MLKNEYSELLWMSSSPNVRICVIGMLINLKVLAILRQTLKEKVHIKENLYNWGGGSLLKVWFFHFFKRCWRGYTEEARQLFDRKRLSSNAMLVERGWNATTTFQKVQMNGRWQQLYLSSSSGLSLFWAPSSKALKQCNWNSRRCTTVSFLGFFVPTPDEVDVQWRKFCWLSSAHGLAGRGRRGSRTVKTNVPPPL